MNFSTPNFAPAYAEIFLLVMICVVLIADLFVARERRITHWLSLATLVGAALLTLWQGNGASAQLTFSGSFIGDRLADVLKMFAYLLVGIVFVYSSGYLRVRNLDKGEFYVLGLSGLLGIMVLSSAHNFLTLYLGLELLSLSLYALVAFDRDSPIAAEAAMKYFVLGAIASGCLLYGMSMLYGVTGSLDLAEVRAALTGAGTLSVPAILGLVFVVVGIAFKLGAVPFHMWLPDIYHGSPTAVTLYIGSASKLGAFALLVRLLADGLPDLYPHWRDMLGVLALLSMALGSVVAIAQTNLKRMLAYSTIAHVGFILMGFLAGDPRGVQAALFYTLAYVLMAAAAFGMILLLSREGFEADRLEDYKGLNQRSPWFAAMMLIVMFGMAGVPPFLGFFAKVTVILAALAAGYAWLAVAAVLFSVIGAYYYLRVIKLMYFDAPEDEAPLAAGMGLRLTLSANSLAVLVLGLMPAGLMGLCLRAVG